MVEKRNMKRAVIFLTLMTGLLPAGWTQQRDRLAELNPVCRNWAVTHTSVAPDGSLWMATQCGEIYRAEGIHSSWEIIRKGELSGFSDETFENIVALDRKTALIVGHMWDDYFKCTTTGGRLWDKVKYVSKRGKWFHSVWRHGNEYIWTGSQDGYLAFSADGGRTFTALRDTAFDQKMGIDDIYMLSADSGWIAGKGLYSTSDNWRTYHRWPTPGGRSIVWVRQWKDLVIVRQDGKTYYTTKGDVGWRRTPLKMKQFEVDNASGVIWALDEERQVVMMEDIDRWKALGVSALAIIGIHNGRLYCRVNEGVMRVGADGVVENCPFLTAERAIDDPKRTLTCGKRLWGYDDNSVYLKDKKGWYRVARPIYIEAATPDPDREDYIIIMNNEGLNYSIDIDGHVEPYNYQHPLTAFVAPGLHTLRIETYKTLGFREQKESISFHRDGERLTETSRTITNENYDPHLSNGPEKKTYPKSAEKDSDTRQLPAASVEEALISLGERYNVYPTPPDFGMKDTLLDLHEVYASSDVSGSNKYGYTITLVNRENDTLLAMGNTSAHVDLGGSTHYPWLLPMWVSWREAEFITYQPVLWQVLREAMPDSMMHKSFLSNSTLHPRYTLQSGDLLFWYNDWEERERAIKACTGKYSRVSLVGKDSTGVWIIEATPTKGVCRKSFNEYDRFRLSWSETFDVYRFTVSFDTAAVIGRAKSLVGKAYDNAFAPDNDAYYSSELIQAVFENLFESKPMKWRDTDGNIPEYWIKHFEKQKTPVPEGIMGTNPTDISLSPLLRKL